MKISKIIECNYLNYAEFLVSDGSHEVICSSIILDNKEPKVGMTIKTLDVFSHDDAKLIISKNKNYYIQKEEEYFKYKVCGTIENYQEALIRVFDLIISLEVYYPDGFNFVLEDGYVEFEVDRFDCDWLDS